MTKETIANTRQEDTGKQTGEKKTIIKNIFKVAIFTIVVTTLLSIFVFERGLLLQIGKYMGIFSSLAFCLVISPGIIKRLSIKPLEIIPVYIRPAKAQIGIAMFLSALSHYLMLVIIPLVKFNKQVNPQSFFIFGFLAMFLSFWLAITSNRFSKKLLSSNWKKLHSLVYAIVWLIFLHTALIKLSPISIVVLTFALLETFSLIKEKMQKNDLTPKALVENAKNKDTN